jgi:hypothetical protein
LIKNYNLGEAFSAQKEHPALQKMKCINFFIFEVIFVLLDLDRIANPDPDTRSWDPIDSESNPDPDTPA